MEDSGSVSKAFRLHGKVQRPQRALNKACLSTPRDEPCLKIKICLCFCLATRSFSLIDLTELRRPFGFKHRHKRAHAQARKASHHPSDSPRAASATSLKRASLAAAEGRTDTFAKLTSIMLRVPRLAQKTKWMEAQTHTTKKRCKHPSDS